MSNSTKSSNNSNNSNTNNSSEKKKRTFQKKKKTSDKSSEKYKSKSSNRSNRSNRSNGSNGSNSSNKINRDQAFWDEFHKAADIFFDECIINQNKADEIMTRCKYELSYTGYNKWFQLNNNDTINIGKETDNNFKRSVFFRNRNFQQRLIDFYYKNLPEVELKFIGPTRSGDLLLKLVPYNPDH